MGNWVLAIVSQSHLSMFSPLTSAIVFLRGGCLDAKQQPEKERVPDKQDNSKYTQVPL